MKLKIKLYLLLACILSLSGSLHAQVVQQSYTTSNGAGFSTTGEIRHFGVAGQSVIGTSTGGTYSTTIGFLQRINREIPAAPGNFLVRSAGSTSLYISWTDTEADKTGFSLERSTSADFTTDVTVFNLAADASSHLDVALLGDTFYYYRIKTLRNGVASGPVTDGAATFSSDVDENWKWLNEIDAAAYGKTSAFDGAGNLFVGGRIEESTTVGVNGWEVAGQGDAFLIKYNSDGNISWATQLSATEDASIERVWVDQNGVVYVSGYFAGVLSSQNSQLAESNGQRDGFVAKIDNSGQLLWLKRFGGIGEDHFSSHVVDGAGNIHLLYQSSASSGNLPAGLSLLSLKPDGTVLRNVVVSSHPSISANELARDVQGNFYVAGQFAGTLSIGPGNFVASGSHDAFYAKLNSLGAYQWLKQVDSDQADNAYAIAVRGAELYVGGFFDGTSFYAGPHSVASSGKRDGYVLQADAATGDVTWLRGIGGNGSDGVLTFDLSSANLLVGGFYGGKELQFSGSAETLSNGFGFISSYNNAGDLQATQRIEGKASSAAGVRGLAVYKNTLAVTGRKSGPIKAGSIELGGGSLLGMFAGVYKYEDVCNTPVSFTVSNVTGNTADLSWNIEGGAEFNALSYTIRYKPFGTIDWTVLQQNGTSLQLTGLLDGVRYLVQVSMSCGDPVALTSAFTNVVEFTTPGQPTCVVPAISNDTEVNSTEHQITWGATTANTYDVRYRLKGTLAWTTVAALTGTTTNLTSLESGMTYQVQVRGVCAAVQTVYSPLHEFNVQGAVSCESPSGFSLTNIEATAATIAWTNQGGESYEIRYKVKGTSIWTTASTTTESISLSELDPGMPYVYLVRTICNASTGLSSVFSGVQEFTTAGLPSCEVPVNFTATATQNSAIISWASANGAALYNVRYRVLGTAAWTTVNAYSNSLILEGLSAGTSYQLQARSVCNVDGSFASLYSEAYAFQTTGASICNTPSQLSVTPGTTDATLSWASQEGVSSYQVRYRLVGTTVWTTLTTATNSLAISSLGGGMPYMWTVRAICNEEGTLASPFADIAYFETVGIAACEVPAGLTVDPVADVSATVSWTSTGASGYQVRYRLGTAPEWTTAETATNSLDLTGLEPGMPYQVQVKSVCDAGLQSAFSGFINFETEGLPSCEIPVGLAAESITTTGATLTWATVDGAANGFEVRYRIKGTALWTLTTTAGNSLSLSELEPGMTYQFSVRSICSQSPVISSVFSVPAEFSTEGLPSCETPSGFSVAASDNDAEISWADAGSLKYELRYRVSGATLWTSAGAGTNSITLGALQTGTHYQFQVRSVCSADGTIKSLFSDVEFFETTGTTSCETPEGLAVVTVGNTNADIVWTGAEGALEYDIRYRVAGTVIWSQVTSANASVTLDGLSAGMPYQLRVRTLCAADKSLVSPYSGILEFNTTGTTACEVPANLTLGITEQTTAQLIWDGANGAQNYEVLYRRQGDIIWTAATTAQTEITLIGLSELTTYQWKVRTNCAADNSLKSAYSAVSTFYTLATPGAKLSDEGVGHELEGLSNEMTDLEVVVYPNPSSDKVFIRMNSPVTGTYQLSVFNLSGQAINNLFEGTLEKDEIVELVWDGANFPEGIYLLKLSGRKVDISKKIILNK